MAPEVKSFKQWAFNKYTIVESQDVCKLRVNKRNDWI